MQSRNEEAVRETAVADVGSVCVASRHRINRRRRQPPASIFQSRHTGTEPCGSSHKKMYT